MRLIAHNAIRVRRKGQVGIVEKNSAPRFFVGDLQMVNLYFEQTPYINARDAVSQKLSIVFVQEKCTAYFI